MIEEYEMDLYSPLFMLESELEQTALAEDKGLETAKFLLKKLKQKSPETFQHSVRVSKISMSIGIRLGMNMLMLEKLYWGGMMHDIGKLAVSEEVLNCKRKLTETEFAEIMLHTTMGYELLNSTKFGECIKEISLFHHERMDGNGYPYGAKDSEIPVLAKICSIADSYDAMTSKRCYRNEVDAKEACQELVRCSGTQFDAVLVNAFIKCL